MQQALLKVRWPEALLDHPGAAEEWGDIDDRKLYCGLRVRMGIHIGRPRLVPTFHPAVNQGSDMLLTHVRTGA